MHDQDGRNVRLGPYALAALAGLLAAGTVRAEDAPGSLDELSRMSLSELTDFDVTSVSRRAEHQSEAAASVYVISREDIRRSGATSLPEALRLAPNLEVARLNAYSWSVSARGFNIPESSNKLLVLVDGRSVYEPIGSGVLWQQVDVRMESIERIEVISGPGGTLWGANAVNGVINVITRGAADTQGPAVSVGGGGFERTAAVRFGGRLGDHASLRVYVNGFDDSATKAVFASDASTDAWRGVDGGFRLDAASGKDSYTLQGDLYRNVVDGGGGSLWGGNVLGRWDRSLGRDTAVGVQAYWSRDERATPVLFEARDAFDLQAQETTRLGARHEVVWGAEAHVWRENFQSFDSFTFARPRTTITLGSIFGQDTYAIRPDLKLTLGLKLEDNNYSGVDWLPNLRAAWRPDERWMVWGAISRAVRTPNRIEKELQSPGVLEPSPDFRSETLVAYELGVRAEPIKRLSFSFTAYDDRYGSLRSFEFAGAPFPAILRNNLKGEIYGWEAWGKYNATRWWRLSVGANQLHKSFRTAPGHLDFALYETTGEDPSFQAQARSEMNLGSRLELDGGFRYVGRMGPAPAYAEADARAGLRLGRSLVLSVEGKNLLQAQHVEIYDPSTTPPRYIPRSVFLRLTQGF
jgi:iron complex outermembrane receptor protein